MDRLDELNLFVRVAEMGSITAAARSLEISTSVASQRIKRLEQRLGVKLLHRTTRRLALTVEGAALLEQVRPLLDELDAITSGVGRAGREIAGTLRVTMPAAFGRLYVSPLLPHFRARHPALDVHVTVADEMLDLVREGLDLAIRIGTLGDSSLVSRKLAVNRRVLCASPGYLRRYGTPKTPEALARHECLVLVGRRGPIGTWTLLGPDGREHVVRVRGHLQANSGEVIRDAALAGQGIALLSTWHVCDDIRAGRLRVVLPGYAPPESGIYAVMPERRLVLPRVRAFVDFLAKRLAGTPPWERSEERTRGPGSVQPR